MLSRTLSFRSWLLRTAIVGLLTMGILFAAASEKTDPKREYEALLALSKLKAPEAVRADEVANANWFLDQHVRLHARGAMFLEQHSTHPLRWDVLVLLRYGGEMQVKVSRSGFRTVLPTPESKAAWDARYFPRLKALLASRDASPSARREALRHLIDHTGRHALAHPAEAATAAVEVRGWLDQHEREFPRSSYLPSLSHTYIALLDATAPDKCVAYLQELEQRYRGTDHLDRQMQQLVAGRKRALAAQALPVDDLWAQLGAFDPAFGDPGRYRGKVVLIGLGPVTYGTFTERLADYHAQFADAGLVIVQVASRNSALGLPSEPEQRRDMEKIVAIRQWPWPVLWNPTSHMEIAKQWGLNSIPAWLLIGRDGRLVSDRATPLALSIPRELARSSAP